MLKSKFILLLSGLIIASTLCNAVRAQSTPRRLRSDPSSQTSSIKENYVTVERLRVRYAESGSGQAVVMIHGNAGSIEDFEFGTIETLASSYRVIAVERPGHGKTDRPNGKSVDVECQAQLLHQVLSSLSVARPVLVGHSWGRQILRGALTRAFFPQPLPEKYFRSTASLWLGRKH